MCFGGGCCCCCAMETRRAFAAKGFQFIAVAPHLLWSPSVLQMDFGESLVGSLLACPIGQRSTNTLPYGEGLRLSVLEGCGGNMEHQATTPGTQSNACPSFQSLNTNILRHRSPGEARSMGEMEQGCVTLFGLLRWKRCNLEIANGIGKSIERPLTPSFTATVMTRIPGLVLPLCNGSRQPPHQGISQLHNPSQFGEEIK